MHVWKFLLWALAASFPAMPYFPDTPNSMEGVTNEEPLVLFQTSEGWFALMQDRTLQPWQSIVLGDKIGVVTR